MATHVEKKAVSQHPDCAYCALASTTKMCLQDGERSSQIPWQGTLSSGFCSSSFPPSCYKLPPWLGPLCTQGEFNK